MDVSVILATHRRHEKLARCIAGLSRQTLAPDRFEVLVGVDGEDPAAAAAAESAWTSPGVLRVSQCRALGPNAARNHVLAKARGRYVVSLNDDVVPDPRLLEIHLAEQRAAEARGKPAIITGHAPWKRHADDSLFDRLVRETSMLFFYDRMLAPGAPPDYDWGFRHCFGLNFSAPLDAVRAAGLFTVMPDTYGYDELELAFRMTRRGMPVLFRPEAVAEHDHRYSPREVLDREFRLGEAAWKYASKCPEFAAAVFGRDITAAAELAYSREFVERERPAAERLERSFLALAEIPSGAVGGPHAPALINLLYEQHLLLKRWMWRRGLLNASR